MRDRERRLATPTVNDNRVSEGCVVVPTEFYADAVRPLLGERAGVVYVLPEQGPQPAT